ncbi:chitinase [Legionella beliardensis]|uniref:Chitinase n=1 Tax=Legionella beliardensis TaxID=91822 RepID=A0A378I3Y5_9GAMM|nr:cellulase family glycosylhydrolase [Legionella beliardensis]STX29572.1 chitinase [Legionella beliardensis]
MRYHLGGLGPLILLTQSVMASVTQPAHVPTVAAQPTTCITSQFTAAGDRYWKNVTLKLTNNCNRAVDFENTTVTFKNTAALNTNFWGDFSPLPYPDAPLNITSQPQSDGTHLATLAMHFKAYPGTTTLLPAGSSIQIKYGVSADTHVDGSVNVYVGGDNPSETGSLQLKNASTKPTNVSQTYALVHLTLNGQKVSDVQLPWNTTVTVPNLAPGSYAISPQAVSDSSGNSYQGTAAPSTVTITAGQQASATVTYSMVQQEGKIAIKVQSLPSEITGYTGRPAVLVREGQSGSTVSQTVAWNTTTTVSQLKVGSTYTFSTDTISYNGYTCTPSFNPASLTASATAPTTNLTYKCVQVAQDTVTLNVTGAPTTLTSLRVTLTPNNNTAPVTTTVSLTNGSGSRTVSLTDGVIYTLSSDPVSGYSVKFTPQPLTATPNATVAIALTKQGTGTPVAVNGQLTVCGTKLCNEHGDAIQLKGMSSHGLQWFSQCMTPAALDALVNSFKSNVIRIALYVQEGGYETNPTQFTQQVSRLIDEITNRGVYVIVDWHILNPGDPNYNLDRAKRFFTDIATAHKSKNNIIYEIANEPNGVSWTAIKTYADQIIPVIRAIDSKAPIIVGTRGWSSLGVSDGSSYQEIVSNPVNFPNIMYAFHFYAASHRDNYLSALDSASNVLPIFVTEFGTQTFSGDGENDFAMSDRYMQLMASKKIGWANWNHSDDFRSGAIWTPGTCSSNVWTDDRLKPAGTYIKNKIQTP